MKKLLTSIFLLTLFSAAFLFNSCTKDDTTKPTISLSGGTANINLGDEIVPPTVTADDNKDGNISKNVIVSGLPSNSDQAGEFIVTYDVTDAAGNEADQASWTLHIGTKPLEGTYTCSIKDSADASYTKTFDMIVTQSTLQYNKLKLNNLGGYGTNQNFIATVVGNTLTLDVTNITIGSDNASITGTGKFKKVGSTYLIYKFIYTEKIGTQDPTIYTTTSVTKIAK